MALLVNAKPQGRGIFLYIFLLPLAISELAAGIVWSAIFTEPATSTPSSSTSA